jgi:putative DNA primase/helicase
MKPTPAQVKLMADRAEARSKGVGSGDAKAFVASVLTEGQINAEVAKLAALPIGVYESERVEAAKRLGFRASILDKLVGAERPKAEETGHTIELVKREPAEGPVDGSALLAGIIGQIGTYIFLSENEKLAVALWVVASHAFDSFFIFPRLRLKSPTKACGKSTLLDIIECLTNKPLIPSNVTGPSLFRVIAEHRPTVLLDEADRYMKGNDDLISIINAGHKKNGVVLRCVGDDQEVRAFSVWAPMAIAAISGLTATVESRSIMVDMQRKPPGHKLRRFRADRPAKELITLASQAARWAADNQITLGNTDPKIPPALSNRTADNWLPLFAVAEAIGGEWPERTAKAATAETGDDDELNIRLLTDIKKVFAGDAMHSTDLVEALKALDGAPWSEVNYGRPLTTARLATILKEFGVCPAQVKIGIVNRNGYRRSQFAAAFAAYLTNTSSTPSQASTNSTALEDNEEIAFQDSTPNFPARPLEPKFSKKNKAVDPVGI